jgi:phasin family protein
MAARKTTKALPPPDAYLAAEAAIEETAASTAPTQMAAFEETAEKMREGFRTSVEEGLAKTRAAYEKAKDASEQNAVAVETSFGAVKAGVLAFNEKSLETVKSLFDAQVAFSKAVWTVKSPAEFATLQNEYARKQVEFLSGSLSEMSTHAQKVAAEAIEPIKARMESAFHFAA